MIIILLFTTEPSSICNYRCVFCFMSDNSFNKKSQGYMGTGEIKLFKDIQAENNVEFISLRGNNVFKDVNIV